MSPPHHSGGVKGKKPRKERLPRGSQGLPRGHVPSPSVLWLHDLISPGKECYPILWVRKLRARRVQNLPNITQLDWNSGCLKICHTEMPVVLTRTDFIDFGSFDHIETIGHKAAELSMRVSCSFLACRTRCEAIPRQSSADPVS